MTFKRGKGKSASFFVFKSFVNGSSDEKNGNSNITVLSQQSELFPFSNRIEKLQSLVNKDFDGIQEIFHF